MSKIRVTPISNSGTTPFEVEGELTRKRIPYKSCVDETIHHHTIFYINGASYPAEIVTVLEA